MQKPVTVQNSPVGQASSPEVPQLRGNAPVEQKLMLAFLCHDWQLPQHWLLLVHVVTHVPLLSSPCPQGQFEHVPSQQY